MTTANLIATAKRHAEKYGEDAQQAISSKCKMLIACERRPKTTTAAVKYRRDLEEFVKVQEAKDALDQ